MIKGHLADFEIKHSLKKYKTRPKTTESMNSPLGKSVDVDLTILNDESIVRKVHSLNRRLIRHVGYVCEQFEEEKLHGTIDVEKIIENSYRLNAIGAQGGHIARALQSPGPHNGHTYVAPDDRYINIYKDLLKPVKIPPPKDLSSRPEWSFPPPSYHFSDEKEENTDEFATVGVDSSDEVFKHDISLFRAYQRPSTTSSLPSLVSLRPITYNTPSSSSSPSSPTHGEIERAKLIWKHLLDELCAAADAIEYHDLVELASLRSPHETISWTVGYIGILLGLDPSWAASKRSLLHEIVPLQRFLHLANPCHIPVKRLGSANEILRKKILPSINLQASKQSLSSIVPLFLRWILCFQGLADIYITAWKEEFGSSERAPEHNNDIPPIQSPSSSQQLMVGFSDDPSQEFSRPRQSRGRTAPAALGRRAGRQAQSSSPVKLNYGTHTRKLHLREVAPRIVEETITVKPPEEFAWFFHNLARNSVFDDSNKDMRSLLAHHVLKVPRKVLEEAISLKGKASRSSLTTGEKSSPVIPALPLSSSQIFN